MIVIHFTAMESSEAALKRLCDPVAEVSAHYLISGQGDVTQMVPEHLRAWHAGAGEWDGQDDINSRSIGIELDNRGNHPFSEPQMVALEALLHGIHSRWAITYTIGHSDMAPGRKFDPGPHFDWARLERLGLAVRISENVPQILDEKAFRYAAQKGGFTAPASLEALLHTTRLRCAPWRKGPLQPEDFALPVPPKL